MIPAPGAETDDWLSRLGQLVALPHGRHDPEFAGIITERILTGKSEEVNEVQLRTSSVSRVAAWIELLSPISEARSREFFSFRPQDAVCLFGAGIRGTKRWSTLAEIYEACYLIERQDDSESTSNSGLTAASRLRAAHLARTRFLLLSLPFAAPPVPPILT